MIYPVLAYKERNDLRFYGFDKESNFKHTSRELLKAGVFNGVFIIDSSGMQYELKNVREVGWANSFWGISVFRKGRQIIVDFDLQSISQKTLDEVKSFVLMRLERSRNDNLSDEVYATVKNADSIEQIIKTFL